MAKLSNPVDSLATAQSLAGWGLNVLPARYKQKAPIVKWQNYQKVKTESMLSQWFGGSGQRNYWVMTGLMSRVIVIDCDTEAGDAWWREQLSDEVLDSAAQVKTSKGTHYWFKIPDSWPDDHPVHSWSVHPDKEDDPNGISFDVRADGTGVIAPPSTHESGHIYTWEKPLSSAADAPPALLDGSLRAHAPKSGAGTDDAGQASAATRSMLTTLLSRPPGGEGTGRNDWLTRVAGHYAKTYHNMEDLYTAHCHQANLLMGDPLDDAEFDKVVRSVWRGEHTRNPERALDASCGWLKSGNTVIMTQVATKDETGTTSYDLEEYADFDLVAKGVMVEEGAARTYWVKIRRKRRGVGDVEEIDTVIPGATFGDDRKLRSFFSAMACTILPPVKMSPKDGSPGLRLQRYLESQHPPIVKVAKTLGWDEEIIGGEGGFITHDGVITGDEVFESSQCGVIANPTLLTGGVAPHRYGFGADEDEARRVLAEVMTFHFEDVTAVFGAWWAACLIKPQIERRTALFPFMAVEAPSESGKTNGFFAQMIELNGNTSGEMNPTMASLRNIAASHRNGIVWVDDLDDPSNLMELIRAATSGGTLAKMAEDRESIRSATIVSPIVISGEALGLGTQKALLDRAVILKAGSPTGRMSLRDASRPQWDDVLQLREKYPDGLSAVAGWLVKSALLYADDAVSLLPALRVGSGRSGDKFAILRTGGRLLDALLATSPADLRSAWEGSGVHGSRIDAWVAGDAGSQSGVQGDNALTLEILPWALRQWNYPDKATAAADERGIATPAYVKNYARGSAKQALFGERELEVYFNTDLLAQAWTREQGGRIEKRTQTAIALTDQAEVLGARSKRVRVQNGGLAYYKKLTGEVAELVIERAQGSK
jgi:hypothetical protein